MPGQTRRAPRNAAESKKRRAAATRNRRDGGSLQGQGAFIDPSVIDEANSSYAGEEFPDDFADDIPETEDAAEGEKEKRPVIERVIMSNPSQMMDRALDWIYDHSLIVFAVYGIIFLALGILFNRYISFGGGLALVLFGYAMSMRDAEKDTFLYYIVGLAIFAIPFIIV